MTSGTRRTTHIVALLLILASASAASAAEDAPPHDPRHILVGWDAALPDEQRALVHGSIGGQVVNRFDHIDVDVVQVPDGMTAVRLVERYGADARVRYAELNTVVQASGVPNDTYFNYLWGLHNTGQFIGYTPDADIDGPEAWDATFGTNVYANSGGIRVGVIDTGIDTGHTEFSGGKIKACARATSGSGTVSNGTCPDDNGHGTHVAGTIAAHINNGTGVAGVAPASELAIAKTLNSAGSGYQTDSIAALYWLRTTGGAKVINMSFGSASYNASFASEVQSAYDAGVLLVAAAGNDGNSTLNYPAGYGPVISVAATNGNDNRASFSNYNSDVELAAPGVNIRSTYRGGGYADAQGTSMASPHVAGVGAAVMATGVTNATARSVMQSTALDRGGSGRDNEYGYGRVNVLAALNAAGLQPAITSPAEGALLNNTSVTFSGTGKAGAPLQLKKGTTVLASTTVSASRTWSATASLGQGAHTVTAVTNPGTGTERISDPRSITVDSIAPAPPVITSPTAGATVTSTSVTFTGTAEPNATITLAENGTLATTTASGSGDWSASVPLSQGNHTVQATARDAATNVSPVASVAFSVAVPPDGPIILTPAASAHIPDGQSVLVSGTSTADAVEVTIKEGSATLATQTPAADGTWSTSLSFADGPHTIAVTARDIDGDVSAPTTRSFLVGATPTVTLENPAPSSLTTATVRISGTATPNALIRIYEGTDQIATGLSAASGAFTLSETMTAGPHTIFARAELVGVQGDATPPRSFTVDVQAPTLDVYNPDPMLVLPTRDPELSGFVSDDLGLGRVAISFTRLNGTPPAPRDADCPDCATALEADWVAPLGNLPGGYYTATIRAYDAAGNVSAPMSVRFVTT